MKRTPTAHNYHCSLLGGPSGSADSVTYGVTARSSLNDIPYFHVCKMMMPQDVMHVLFEGVLSWEVRLMLNDFIEKKYFSLDELNNRISHFAYGRAESRNKPPNVFLIHHIREGGKFPLSGMYVHVKYDSKQS